MKKAAALLKMCVTNLGKIYPHPWFALCFLALAVCELILLSFHPNSFWNNSSLVWYETLTLVALSVLTWASFSWIVWWLLALARSTPVGKNKGVVLFFLLAVCFSSGLLFYVCSWVFFWRTGAFLDWESLTFGGSNLLMMGHYLWQSEQTSLLLAAAVCVFGFCLAVYGFKRLQRVSDSIPQDWSSAKIGRRTVFLTVELVFVLVLISSLNQNSMLATIEWWNHAGPDCDYELRTRLNPVLTMTVQSAMQAWQNDELEGELTAEESGPLRSTPYEVNQRLKDSTEQYSVIYIAIEALRSDVVLLKHQGREVMPHLNQLARKGMNFTRCYAQSTHSNYADPCLFSSLYPLRTAGHHYYSRTDPWPKVMLYDVLKQHGYATAIYSSQNETWGHMDAILESPGLDVFFDSRSYAGATRVSEKDVGFAQYAQKTHVAGKLDDAITVEQAIDWISRQEAKQQPFVLCMNLQSSHFPYELPSGQTGPFQPATIDFPASFVSYPKDKIPVMRNAYYNSLHYIDEQIGKLVTYLDAHQLRDKTILVLAGDQGEAFYENGFPTHAGPPFEPTIRTALVIDVPHQQTAQTIDYLTQAIDIVPTICGLLDVPVHPCFQGIDVLSPERPAEDRRLAFVHCQSTIGKSDAVISGTGWKLVHDREKETTSLYHLNEDPGETTDVLQEKPEMSKQLAGLLQQWRRQQLLYYQNPASYGWYYPPRTPRVFEPVLLRDKQD
ncbi:Lipoteichoic acid synthase 2 [Gimesia maris]|uniref:sulfatase-like hydrolase/transferase n=1 Tax=Gimesia maris TaxID=122 RepID=UPI00118BFF75|nr:sulfatase-like hydrolase/transferase [Gimesia maris]QDT78396.1 Lipoteichoic acid synthase 2 [Gimesia maris]